MQLVLMRHGIAAPLGGDITEDAERPLTPEGQKKTHRAAAGLVAAEVALDLIATSPLLRARETAAIVREVYEDKADAAPPLAVWPELEHAELKALLPRLKGGGFASALLVGHEPSLGHLVSHLLTGSPEGMAVDFKKAGACALEVSFQAATSQATLLWFATPGQLKLMAG